MAEIALVRFVNSEWLRYGKEYVVRGRAAYANISLINSQAFNGLSRGGAGRELGRERQRKYKELYTSPLQALLSILRIRPL